MHFSPVCIFVFDSKQEDHFDSLCLEYVAIIQSFSASCVDASYQFLFYSVYTSRNSLLGQHLNICVKFSLTG